jgi:hypothetical protein
MRFQVGKSSPCQSQRLHSCSSPFLAFFGVFIAANPGVQPYLRHTEKKDILEDVKTNMALSN